jgi:hypothetical protein
VDELVNIAVLAGQGLLAPDKEASFLQNDHLSELVDLASPAALRRNETSLLKAKSVDEDESAAGLFLVAARLPAPAGSAFAASPEKKALTAVDLVSRIGYGPHTRMWLTRSSA